MTCPYCSPDYSSIQFRDRLSEDKMQFESLRRAVTSMIEQGQSPKQVMGEIMWRLEVTVRQPPPYEMSMTALPQQRIHPEWGYTEFRGQRR